MYVCKHDSSSAVSYEMSYFQHLFYTLVTAFDTSVYNRHLPAGGIIILKLLCDESIRLHVCCLGNGIYILKFDTQLWCWLTCNTLVSQGFEQDFEFGGGGEKG